MAAALAPDGGELDKDSAMHGKLESLQDRTAIASASMILTQLQLAALKIRRDSEL